MHRFANVFAAFVLLALCSFPAIAQTPSVAEGARASTDYETDLSAILSEIVAPDGRVDYAALGTDHRTSLHQVLRAIETFNLEQLGHHDARLAFWMNAYNVHMLKNILEHPDLENVLANGMGDEFFKTPRLVGGLRISLDELEHVILRGEERRPDLAAYKVEELDPRIHVGLNCAALSCPPLRSRAFTAKNVHTLLDEAMRDFVNNPDHFQVTENGYRVSSLLDWFGPDFDAMGQPAGDFLRSYLSDAHPDREQLGTWLEGKTAADLKASDRVTFYYDWTVNRAN